MAKTYDLFKLVLVGDSQVGKTSILSRFAEDSFSSNLFPTIGVDFKVKTVDIDEKEVKLQIWDIGGGDRFRSIKQPYYRRAKGVVIVYDVTDNESFDNIVYSMEEIEKFASDDVEVMILGNKCDLQESRVVSTERGKILADEYKAKYMDTSAKSSINVNQAFLTMARDLCNKQLCEDDVCQAEPVSVRW